ncbi:MAG: type II secretion system protein [Phycisphaerales bacterium]
MDRPARARTHRHAFTIIELLMVIAIIALLVSILLPALGEAKRSARMALNTSNMKQFGSATQSYGADFRDSIWAFNWRAGTNYGPRSGAAPVTYTSVNDVDAAAQQAVDIIRRRSEPQWLTFPLQAAWIPHIFYTHLVVMDYLAARLPEPIIRSPFDRIRHTWAEALWDDPANPQNVPARFGLPQERWPYSSSYETAPASYSPDRWNSDGGSLMNMPGEWGVYLYNSGTSGRYRLGGRKVSDVAYPSNKVHQYENVMRHEGKIERYWTHWKARVTVLNFDASVKVLATVDANEGGHLLSTNQGQRAPIRYTVMGAPDRSFPRWADGESTLTQPARYRWTVGGLRGADHGIKEPFAIQ